MRHGHPVCWLGLCAAALLAPAAFAQNTTPLFVTANPAGLAADALARVAPNLSATTATFSPFGLVQSIESVAFSGDDAYATFDGPTGTGGLLFEAGLGAETTGRNLELGDRVVYGPATGLVAPRGLLVVPSRSWVLVADTGPASAPAVRVFAPSASGDAAPLFTVANLGTTSGGTPRAPWDVAYDTASDRLFVAGTDGVVAVFDNFSATQGAPGPSRTITPAEGGVKISVNLHGIVYVPGSDYLLLSDVGAAASAADGQVFVVAGASTASGLTAVRFRNAGPATMLGNPVDVAFAGGSLYVAEKINNQVQRYDGVLALTGTANAAPNAALPATNPESVDFTGAGALFAALNTPTRDSDAVARLAPDLSAVTATFGGLDILTSIESVTVASDGTGVLTFDGRSGGGLLFVNDLAGAMAGRPVGLGDRFVYGPATGLVMPKGLIGVAARNWLLVADVGPAPAVRVFAPSASGNAAPLFTVANLGTTSGGTPRAPWDVDYDTASDRLFVAGTDGVVAVFDAFSVSQGATGPSRTITPAEGGVKISVNLHGIDYVPGADLLVLTDVGSAASATDGQLFTIAGASTASGLTAVRFRNAGPATMLGNPVDVVTDGVDAYVAEKSNSMVQRYDGVLALTGSASAAPNVTLAVTNPESVAFSSMRTLACMDPATEPMYAGGVVRNTAGNRTFIRVVVPTGGVSFVFYNTSNLVVGAPETSPNSGVVLTGFVRTGSTFTFGPAASPAEVFFPISTEGPSTIVRFFLRITDTCGRTVDVDPTLTVTGTETETAAAFGLDGGRPNPTTGPATIRFSLGTAGPVRLAVYDVLGREVVRLVDEPRGAGAHAVPFDGGALPAGLYVYRLDAEGRTATRTLTIAR